LNVLSLTFDNWRFLINMGDILYFKPWLWTI
jgi:hypothetical protein